MKNHCLLFVFGQSFCPIMNNPLYEINTNGLLPIVFVFRQGCWTASTVLMAYTMISNYLRTTFRYFWRHRLFTLLNVLGLAIGISAAWMIYRMVDYEFNYDKHIPDADRIYQVVSKSTSDAQRYQLASRDQSGSEIGSLSGVDKAVINVMLNDAPGAELVVPMFHHYYQHSSVVNEQGENVLFDDLLIQVKTLPSYFEMMPHHWLAGDKNTALTAPGQVVLTENKANTYFPGLSPDQILGRTIAYNDTLYQQVVGVVSDLDFPNSIHTGSSEFTRMDEADLHRESWGTIDMGNLLFFKTAPGVDPLYVIEPVNDIQKQLNDAYEERDSWNEVLPLTEKHFSEISLNFRSRVADKQILYGLMAVGGFLLFLACINYVNLSTALLPQRAREIGMRKTLGGTPSGLFFRFVAETAILTVMAMVLSIFITHLAGKFFAPFLPEGMEAHFNYGGMVAFGVLLILVISLLSGLYPAYLSVRIDTVSILKGQTSRVAGPGSMNFRQGLIVFQFFIAQLFIIAAVIMGQQLHYATHKDLGFTQDAVMTVEIPYKTFNESENKGKPAVLLNELKNISTLQGVAMGDPPMKEAGNALMNYYAYRQGAVDMQQAMILKYVDEAYLNVYGIDLLAGRTIRPSDSAEEIVLSETALAGFGFSHPEEAVGQMLTSPYTGKLFPIVGVIADFHPFGLQMEMQPIGLHTDPEYLISYNIKLPQEMKQWPAAIQAVEKAWSSVYQGVPFEYRFYDEHMERIYAEELKTQKLIAAATTITIFISCLGLFGLVTLTAFQRTKEIGIRKVLGASVSSIVSMLSKDFIKLILVAIIIASPIAWWAMSKWLEDFAYRIEIQWWMFASAGVVSVGIALLTMSWQAVRAALAKPVDSLRDE